MTSKSYLDMFINLLRIFTSEEILKTHALEANRRKASDTTKYADEIVALKEKYGNVKEIEINLQELLKLCPRTRPRTDAYKGLVAELKEQGINLYITSRKRKKEV